MQSCTSRSFSTLCCSFVLIKDVPLTEKVKGENITRFVLTFEFYYSLSTENYKNNFEAFKLLHGLICWFTLLRLIVKSGSLDYGILKENILFAIAKFGLDCVLWIHVWSHKHHDK